MIIIDIALSNLHRQFLYRKQHIRKQKSDVAAAVAKELNPNIKITSYNALLKESSLDLFGGDEFFSNIDLLISAVDNFEAREFLDVLGLFYSKPMLGT